MTSKVPHNRLAPSDGITIDKLREVAEMHQRRISHPHYPTPEEDEWEEAYNYFNDLEYEEAEYEDRVYQRMMAEGI